jgi:hypothetical protein
LTAATPATPATPASPATARPPPAITVLWRDLPGAPVEGGRARRFGIVAGAGDAADVRRLSIPAGGRRLARAASYVTALAQALAAAITTPAPRVLLFYPDLPAFMPARWWKLPLLAAWLALLRAVLSLRGRELFVDVVDVPRWQAVSLHYELPLPAGVLRAVERLVFGLADRVTVTTATVARELALDLSLPRSRFRVLVNGSHAWIGRLPRARTGGRERSQRPDPVVRFIYLGCLDRTQDRGIRRMCRAFIAASRDPIELVLIGESGDWIPGEFPAPGLRVLPPLPEADCVPWLRSSHFALIPYPTAGYYRTVCPTKLALYAQAGVPVVATPMDEVRVLVERHRLGECLEPEEVFARWRELVDRYEDYTGGTDLEALTWESAVRRAGLLEPAGTDPATGPSGSGARRSARRAARRSP